MFLQAYGQRIKLEWDDGGDLIPRRIRRLHNFYERDLLEDAYRRVKGPGVAVDVGAHIGNHSLWFAKMCGLDVVAIEPDDLLRVRLQQNLDANHVSATVIPAAAGAANGWGTLERVNPTNTGMNRVLVGRGPTRVVTVDSLQLEDVKLLKIDVEGAELDVLRGALDTIQRCHPVVYVESAVEESHREVSRLLAARGYQQFGKYCATPTYGYSTNRTVLSAAIMAHPRRAEYVKELVKRVPGAQVVWDERNDRWDTGRRSMLAYHPAASHHLVVQDDAIVCEDLLESVERALAVRPHSPLSFYLGRQRPNGPYFNDLVRKAKARRLSWVGYKDLCWGVAVCLPTAWIPDMIRWCDKRNVQNYDMRMSHWLEMKKFPTFYSLPSLVEHRRGDVSPSLIPGRTGINRVAHWFIGENESGLNVEWGHGSIGRVPERCVVCGASKFYCVNAV